MTVKELKEALEKFDEELPVLLDWYPLDELREVEFDGKIWLNLG